MEAQDLNQLFQDCMPLFIALGDEVRLTIISALVQTSIYNSPENDMSGTSSGCNASGRLGMNVKEITEQTRLSRPAISHHLKILKEADLIDVRQEGTSNYYYLTIGDSTQKLYSLGQFLQGLLGRIS